MKYALTVCLHILGFVLPGDHFGRFLSDDQLLFCALPWYGGNQNYVQWETLWTKDTLGSRPLPPCRKTVLMPNKSIFFRGSHCRGWLPPYQGGKGEMMFQCCVILVCGLHRMRRPPRETNDSIVCHYHDPLLVHCLCQTSQRYVFCLTLCSNSCWCNLTIVWVGTDSSSS